MGRLARLAATRCVWQPVLLPRRRTEAGRAHVGHPTCEPRLSEHLSRRHGDDIVDYGDKAQTGRTGKACGRHGGSQPCRSAAASEGDGPCWRSRTHTCICGGELAAG